MPTNYVIPSGIHIIVDAFIVHYNECLIALLDDFAADIVPSGLSARDYLTKNGKDIVQEMKEIQARFIAMLSFDSPETSTPFLERLNNIRISKLVAFANDLTSGEGFSLPGIN